MTLRLKILANDKMGMYVIWRGTKVKLQIISDKYIVDYSSKELDKIKFEKNKQRSMNRMLDAKILKLEKKESEVLNLIAFLKKEKEQINTL